MSSISWAISTNSHKRGLVSRGSIMSNPCPMFSPPVDSAVLNGEAIAFNLASISWRLDSGSSDEAITLLSAAEKPPYMCMDPHLPEGQAYRWYIPLVL